MPDGWIVKALSGNYYVRPDDGGEIVRCRARGIFRKEGRTPLVGDRVRYSVTGTGEGTVDDLHPRSSELIRPPVANVELAVLVFAVTEPDLSLQLLDKFLVHTEHAGLDLVIVLSKFDLPHVDSELIGRIRRLYGGIGYDVLPVSSRTGKGLEALRRRLAGRIAVFSGQSGVGKSSLLNALVPGLSLETSEISLKLGRGRHTTRHVELIPLPGGGYVADTPGFSQLEFANLEPEDLGGTFREFRALEPDCRFRGCMHLKEPGCAVRDALERGEVAESRYEHYVQFLEEMKDRKRRY